MRPIALLLLTLTAALALDQGGAEAAVARGWAAYNASDVDRTQLVPAALAFTEALHFYEGSDEETSRELRANIFWIRKRMSEDTLDQYLAAKSGDAMLVQDMKTVADRPVAPSEATDYFAKAEAFAKVHPTEHLKLAIRYFEVASRFPGTQESMDAQKRSLDEQVQAKTGEAKLVKASVAAITKPAPKKLDLAKADPAKVKAYYKRWVLGTWLVKCQGYSGVWTFNDSGTITRPGDSTGRFDVTKDAIALHWPNGQEESMQLVLPDADQNVATGTNFMGLPLTFTRKEPLKIDEFVGPHH